MGIVDLFRREKRSREVISQALAMVLLHGRDAPATEDVFGYLQRHWTDLPSMMDIRTVGGATTARIPGGVAAVAHIAAPIPPDDLTGPAAVAWHWPTAAADLAMHRSHLIVHAESSSLDMIDVRLFHTKLAAAAVAMVDGIGIYVGDSMLVRSAEDYIAEARTADRAQVPVALWVGFHPVNDDGFVSAYTTGLNAFGLPELEALRTSRAPAEVLGMMADVAAYQLQSGAALAEGETFGYNEVERIPVEYATSEFLPDATVALLKL